MQKNKSNDRYPKLILETRNFEARLRAQYKEIIGKYGLRGLNIGTILSEINRGVHDEGILPLLKKSLEIPLEELFKLLASLDEDSRKFKEKTAFEEQHKKYKQEIATQEGREDKFIIACLGLTQAIHQLREDENDIINILDMSNARCRREARECERLIPLLKKKMQELSTKLTGVEFSLHRGEKFSSDCAKTHADEILQLQKNLHEAHGPFETAKLKYENAISERNTAFELLRECERKEAEFQAKLQSAQDWAKEMEIDLYLALGEEKKELSQESSLINECRVLLNAELPQIPKFEAAGKILEKTRTILEKLKVFFAQEKTPSASEPVFTVISRESIEEKNLGESGVAAPEAQEKLDVLSPMKFSVCAFGAFCNKNTRLGRTARKVYKEFLEPKGYTFGLSLDEFLEGVIEAEDLGYLILTKVPGQGGKSTNEVYKNSKTGLLKARDWLKLLPVAQDDFISWMRQANEEARKKTKDFIEKVLKKKSAK